MLYSASARGFYSCDIHGDSIPRDAVDLTDEQYAELLAGQSAGRLIEPDANGFPALVDREILPPQVPVKVTMRQARLALLSAGLLDSVEVAINSLPEPPRTAARIEWDFSSEVFRHRDFVLMLGNTLGLDSEEMDELFITAATL
jgi:hypothetical protein